MEDFGEERCFWAALGKDEKGQDCLTGFCFFRCDEFAPPMQEAVSNMVWGLLNPAAKNPWFRTKTPFFQGRFDRGHSTGPDIGGIKQCNDIVL